MTLSRFLLLLEGTAFFPSVKTLQAGDPLEGAFFIDDVWLTTAMDELFPNSADSMNEFLEFTSSPERKRWIDRNRKHPEFMTHMLAQTYVSSLIARRAVWCWFQGEHESAAMWSVYGNAGVAVKTNIDALAEALPGGHWNFVFGGVRYLDRRPNRFVRDFNPEREPEVVLRPHFIKGMEFQHEKEVRVATSCFGNEKGRVVEGIDAKKLIQEIVISPWLPSDEVRSIIRLIERNDWGGKVPKISISTIIGKTDEAEIRIPNMIEVVPAPLDKL